MKRNTIYFAGDFETTVYENQTETEVWASGVCELYTEDVHIFHSIDETFQYFRDLKCNVICYYHNLKFDGEFWMYFLLFKLKFKQHFNLQYNEDNLTITKESIYKMKTNTFSYSISDMGQWYSLTIRLKDRYIEFRDSVKLMPMSLDALGKSFNTKHKKLEMEYTGYRYAGCEISNDELLYLRNDVLCLKECLEEMFNEGHDKLTIGSCCMAEFKGMFHKDEFNMFFPNLYNDICDLPVDDRSVGEFIRRSYKGAWCYVKEGKENKIHKNGVTFDVNSLYPSVMEGESGNFYPVGKPYSFVGEIPKEAKINNRYYFIRLKTRFKLKKNKLPFIQIKGSFFYNSTDMLKTSDYYDKTTGNYYPHIKGFNGELIEMIPELTLTCTDYQLMLEHYDLYDTEFIGGYWFETEIGIFDEYLDKYRKIKENNKGAKRTIAKYFSNNLYGKLAMNDDSSFKYYEPDYEQGEIKLHRQEEFDKTPGYIPCGSAITSYAREFTIRYAQKVYKYFLYADTDSLHCLYHESLEKILPIHPSKYLHWKNEGRWNKGLFLRQKSYIEIDTDNVIHITCSGMKQRPKELFIASLEGAKIQNNEVSINIIGEEGKPSKKIIKLKSKSEREFVSKKRKITDFTYGLTIPGQLKAKRIKGGIILAETEYKLRKRG